MSYPELLRSLAYLIEEHDLFEPTNVKSSGITVHSYLDDAPQQMAKWRRALGGTWSKHDFDDFITLDLDSADSLPGHPRVVLFIGKNACVRRVVGIEDVIIPAVEARPETVETKEIVEWDCEPVLAQVAS